MGLNRCATAIGKTKGSRLISDRLCPAPEDAWAPWQPAELATRLAPLSVTWYVVGGWALDLWHGRQTRPHEDLEFATLAADAPRIRDCLSELTFFAAQAGRLTALPLGPLPDGVQQFWGLDPGVDRWRLDMMLEPGTQSDWVYKRDPAIRGPRGQFVRRSATGLPYLAPEAVLLFKAKHQRDKDETDFDAALPRLTRDARDRLGTWLDMVHPAHAWQKRL